MPNFETSIIIPVYNRWELTRACLKTLAATVDKSRLEVIVVDNASTDATPGGCAFLGKSLFGDSFTYIRNEQNRNFAGASNQGADAAKGSNLLFLNNDTEAQPGWYEPLLEDFNSFPSLGGTGSLLIYPGITPFGRAIQHLGVLVSPFMKFGHLYQGIPATSPLAKERRFFEAITGACMFMPKSLFFKAGKFDENYINGLEDIDLCARILKLGYRFTVNPASVIIHLESQTPGRGQNEADNFRRLAQTNIGVFRPDWETLLNQDGMELKVNEWVQLQACINSDRLNELNEKLPLLDRSGLKETLIDNPYWEAGWQRWLAIPENRHIYLDSFKIFFKLFRTISNAAKAVLVGRQFADKALETHGEIILKGCRQTPEQLLENAKAGKAWCLRMGLAALVKQYDAWINGYEYFKNSIYPQWMQKYFSTLNG